MNVFSKDRCNDFLEVDIRNEPGACSRGVSCWPPPLGRSGAAALTLALRAVAPGEGPLNVWPHRVYVVVFLL